MQAFDFLLEVQQQTTISGVSQLLSVYGASLGFPTHAIAPVPTEDCPVGNGMFLVQNWPAEWDRVYRKGGFADFDPIPRAAAILTSPMRVSDVYAGMAGFQPHPRSTEILAFAASLGRPEGMLIPIFGPNGYRAIACFAGAEPHPDAAALAALHIWAIYAHDQILALTGSTRSAKADKATLSSRETDVLSCALNGLSDAEIAHHLGITIRTVRFHFSNARRKFDVRTRSQCIGFAKNAGLL